jgi:hypothetical protein
MTFVEPIATDLSNALEPRAPADCIVLPGAHARQSEMEVTTDNALAMIFEAIRTAHPGYGRADLIFDLHCGMPYDQPTIINRGT